MSPGARYVMNTGLVYWSMAIFTIGLGLFLIVSPPVWFGATWLIFGPRSGFWFGFLCLVAGNAQMLALGLNAHARLLSVTFLTTGFLFWLVGLLFAVQGVSHHTGMMETPFIWYIAGHSFAHSATLMAYGRQQKSPETTELLSYSGDV